MKEHTKAVLEACTGQLVALGLERRRRGHAIWSMNAHMWGGIGMQVQTRRGQVLVTPVAQVMWDPVERLVAIGRGREYRPWGPGAVTRATIVVAKSARQAITFEEDQVNGDMLDRFGTLARQHLVARVLDMADERAITAHYSEQVNARGGKAEYLLAIRAWQGRAENRVMALDRELGWLLTALESETARSRLLAFHDRLIHSDQTAMVLAEKVAAE